MFYFHLEINSGKEEIEAVNDCDRFMKSITFKRFLSCQAENNK